jgi:hypothetical protein
MKTNQTTNQTITDTNEQFINAVRQKFQELETEIADRNQKITERDDYIYGDRLQKALDVPIGHDFTPVNWLRRTVEIHKNMFMARGFQILSTYDTNDLETAADEEDRKRLEIENQKEKTYAEARMNTIRAIIDDNGGDAFWSTLAENASAVGDVAVKMYWDEDEQKLELCNIESIENLYALWSKDDFRDVDAYAYVYQVSKQEAISEYGAPEDVQTSPLGSPLEVLSATGVSNQFSGQPMVSILEVTGKIEGWKSEKGKVKECKVGDETELNALIIGNYLARVIDDEKKIPKYYLLPNKRQRRRPWGASDVSEAAININLTYVETLSDWRTVSAKVNFPKFKAFGFAPDQQLPKPESRKIQYLPMSEGQDIQELTESQSNSIDWGRQLDECKEQFVRETGISRVLFDDPSVTLNSNQALLTSMKPTSDIAEAKKQLWTPVIVKMFNDALQMLANAKPEAFKEIADTESSWTLKVMWPSVMQKEDPVYQSMILNRFNAGTMSLQSYLEAQGESKEEIDRIRSEMTDPITAAILGKQMPLIAQTLINAATAEIQAWYQMMQPQTQIAAQQAETQAASAEAQAMQSMEGVNPNGGGSAQVQPDNQATGGVGMSPVSQPGTGATAASPGGALAQANQNMGG